MIPLASSACFDCDSARSGLCTTNHTQGNPWLWAREDEDGRAGRDGGTWGGTTAQAW